MAPSRRKGASKAAAAAAARRQWKVGDLVLAKVKGFPAWPATVSEPEKWGYSADWKKVLVYFFGTQQIAFCNPADVEAFTEEKKESLLVKRQGKGSDFVRAVQEIIDCYDKLKKQEQVDLKTENGLDVANGPSTVESSPDLQSKDLSGTPAETSNLQSKCSNVKLKIEEKQNSLSVKDATGAEVDNRHEIQVSEDQTDDGVVAESRPLSTYSLRKKSGRAQVESSSSQGRAPSARRSRSSSRLELCKQENLNVPCEDGEKVAGVSSSTIIQEGRVRKSRRTRRTVDGPKGGDVGSPICVPSGSLDDNVSEILSMDSDSNSVNEGSAVDSGCKLGHSEMQVECVEGDLELRKGLDLKIKAVVVRKKRKPNRKRVIHDASEPTSNGNDRVSSDVEMKATGQHSESDSLRLHANCQREDGDEHLPLVKRARVRMSKSSLAEAVLNASSHAEEKVSMESTVNLPLQNTASLDCDEVNAAVTKEALDVVSPLENHMQSSELRHQPWKDKNQAYVGSTDVEAALPPSKRLHRALEAMSANAAEECPSSNGASVAGQMASSECCAAIPSLPCVAFENQVNDGLRLLLPDSLPNDAPGSLVSSLYPTGSDETANSSEDVNSSETHVKNSEDKMRADIVAVARDDGDEKHAAIALTAGLAVESATQMQCITHLSPQCEVREDVLRLNEVSPDQALHEIDEVNTAEISQNSGGCKSPTTEAEKTAAVSSSHGTEDLKQNSRSVGCENMGADRLNPHEDGICCVNARDNACEAQHERAQDNNSLPLPNGHLCDRETSITLSSVSLADRANTPQQASPPRALACDISTSENTRSTQKNGSMSPVASFHQKKALHSFADSEGKLDSLTQQLRSVGKSSNSSDAHAVVSSFEAVLGTLTRTKESIGRATRVAIDCAKFGLTAKAVDVLARNLESEPSLHRRVDLFFLIDSIMQCSRGLKGDAGGAYPSAIQAVLSRLLSAAAPPGSTAQENRRQCLKVLRLWLERRILPESVVRHHMRELDTMGGSSSGGAYSRRSSRTERSFDDPIREMEGMLVDEYGSNSSFQLPGFCMPRMRKDDEGSDSDESFEAVTPEHASEAPEQEMTTAIEKHRHILQDVDVELEMEDVAPSEVEMNSTNSVVDSAHTSQNIEPHFRTPFVPPEVLPASPSRLPSPVPPPPPPLHPPPHPPFHSAPTIPDHLANGVNQHVNANAHSIHDNLGQSVCHQPVPPRIDPRVHFHASESRERQRHIPAAESTSSYGRRPGSNHIDSQEADTWNHKPYPMRPPHPVPSNQFSYVHSDQRVRSRRDVPPPSHNRFHFSHNRGGGNHYNHERMKPPQYETRENWRYSAPFSGPRYHDKAKNYGPGPYDCPPCEPPRLPNHGWAHPPRPMNHRNYVPYRPPHEAPNFWRPR